MEIKIEQQVRGTRILYEDDAMLRRKVLDKCRETAEAHGFREIVLPFLEKTEIYTDKAGPEILGQMYTFEDSKGRNLCLRPEGTATCQLIANERFKFDKNVKIWYEIRCWRRERPQAGRYREFTQFGVEVLNPTDRDLDKIILKGMSQTMVQAFTEEFEVLDGVKRGLSYYTEEGFEVICPQLGAQKQVVGGGAYKEGIGFAVGIDRLMLVAQKEAEK